MTLSYYRTKPVPDDQKSTRAALITFAISLIATSCSPASEQTPEPGDNGRANALVEKLGTDRTYNSKSLTTNSEPDGLVLAAWLRRREATLANKLHVNQLPALTNPGAVAKTIAWERETQRLEANAPGDFGRYMTDVSARAQQCPRAYEVEMNWFDTEKRAWRNGQRTTFVDFTNANDKFKATCGAEASGSNATESRAGPDQQSASAGLATNRSQVAACEAQYASAQEQRQEALQSEAAAGNTNAAAMSEVRGRAASDARTDCLRPFDLSLKPPARQ
jgi:hypothetical protein